LTGHFKEKFELKTFPFDAQDLQVSLRSAHAIGHPARQDIVAPEVRLVANTSKKYAPVVNLSGFAYDEEYALSPSVLSIRSLTDPDLSQSGCQYPGLNFALKVVRRPEFYLYNVVLPLFLLVAIAFSAFALTPEFLPDKLNIIMTILLTTVAYKLYIGDHIPKVSYLTYLDKYILLCYFILSGMAAWTTAVYVVSKNRIGPCSEAGKAQLKKDGLDPVSALSACWNGDNNLLEDRVAGFSLLSWIIVHLYLTIKIRQGRFAKPTCLERAAGANFAWHDPEIYGSVSSVEASGGRLRDAMHEEKLKDGTSKEDDVAEDAAVLLHHSRQARRVARICRLGGEDMEMDWTRMRLLGQENTAGNP